MRDDRPAGGPGARVQPELDVSQAEPHRPQHSGGHALRRAGHRPNVPRLAPHRSQSTATGRHADGDINRATERRTSGPRKVTLGSQSAGGSGPAQTLDVHQLKQGGAAATAMHKTHESIEGFARASFSDALQRGSSLHFSTKNMMPKAYDGWSISWTSSSASTRPNRKTLGVRRPKWGRTFAFARRPDTVRRCPKRRAGRGLQPGFATFCKNRGNRRRESAKTRQAPLTR